MKTHVRTKLGWSKLVLVTAVLAVVAMLSVIGLCFTNANADDTADPANAEINIPVSILDPDPGVIKKSVWASTSTWAPKKSTEFTVSGSFDKHTHPIVDKEHQWDDKSGLSDATVSSADNSLIITLCTVDGQRLFKSWKFTPAKKGDWYVVFNNRTEQLSSSSSLKMRSDIAYSFFFGKPQTFNILDSTKGATKVKVEAYDFDQTKIEYEAPISQIFTLNSQAASGEVFYNPSNPYDLYLKFVNKNNDRSTYTLTLEAKFLDVNYFWTYDGKEISSVKGSPTNIDPYEMTTIPFTFEKSEEPKPEPITSFNVKGTLVDKAGNPIPNATVGFYNAEMDVDFEEPMVSALTDENGNFVLEGCNTGTKEPEKGLKITYAAKHYGMDDFPFNYEDIKSGEVTLEPIKLEPAIIDLYSDSPQHKSFTITEVHQEIGKEPEIRFSRNLEYYGISELSSNGIDNPIFNISDNGVLVNTDDEGTTLTITPNGQDGYIFDNYVINDKTTYRVGDTVDIMQIVKEDSQAKINTNYVADTSKIAQTSDENIYAVVAIIAIVATVGTLLVLRRRKQDL